jgi:hypothetical protein
MIQILISVGGFLLAVVASEVVLRGTKIQTGLFRVLLVHAVIFFLTAYALTVQSSYFGLLIFWIGAFLTWFGVRSHMESSILLRMVYLLSKTSMTAPVLLTEYESHYGEALRIEELFRSGLIQTGPEGVTITRKGEFILNAVSKLI